MNYIVLSDLQPSLTQAGMVGERMWEGSLPDKFEDTIPAAPWCDKSRKVNVSQTEPRTFRIKYQCSTNRCTVGMKYVRTGLNYQSSTTVSIYLQILEGYKWCLWKNIICPTLRSLFIYAPFAIDCQIMHLLRLRTYCIDHILQTWMYKIIINKICHKKYNSPCDAASYNKCYRHLQIHIFPSHILLLEK